jgi:predicted transglutaminase-like cysteine proteinase
VFQECHIWFGECTTFACTWRLTLKTPNALTSNLITVVIMIAAAQLCEGVAAAQQPAAGAPTTVPSKSAPSQPVQVVSAGQAVPDHVIYRIFFSHVEQQEHAAEALEAEGKDGSGMREHDQRSSGLTQNEAALMKQVAFDCNQSLKDKNEKVHSDIDAYRMQHPEQSRAIPPGEMSQAISDRNEAVTEHIAQLRTMLGEQSFKKLDTYVRILIQPKVMKAPAHKPARSIDLTEPLQ